MVPAGVTKWPMPQYVPATMKPLPRSICQTGISDSLHLSKRWKSATTAWQTNGGSVEIRHLDTLIAIAEKGSFTAAADALRTVQSNVSEQVRQLETELGVDLVVRGRSGATLTESGAAVLKKAHRIKREIEQLRDDVADLHGLRVGNATLGVVGTASRWLVPKLVAELRRTAPGIRMRVNEAASERLIVEVLSGDLAQAVVTDRVRDDRLAVEPIKEETLVGLAPKNTKLSRQPVSWSEVAKMNLVLPPQSNPLRREIEDAATANGVSINVPVEVEGIRLISYLVEAGAGFSVLPETAIPPELSDLARFEIANLPTRRLALITLRNAPLSRADELVREMLLRIVADAPLARPKRRRASSSAGS